MSADLSRESKPGPVRIVNETEIEAGQWVWVRVPDKADRETLGCVMHVGSNYVLVEYPGYGPRGGSRRIHFDNWFAWCTPEPDAEAYLARWVNEERQRASRAMQQIQEITQRLGLRSRPGLPGPGPDAPTTTALSTLNRVENVDQYKTSLVQAKDEELPGLFNELKDANEEVARWTSASMLPLKAQAGDLRSMVKTIEDRVFNVELYAGLTEEVERVADGDPAGPGEKLHVVQQRLYMDEECLAAYQHGGMEFEAIGEFDEWLSQPTNRDRLLPWPRTLVAFRVRREEKEREAGSPLSLFINIQLAEADRTTFLYIRNGDQIYRINSSLAFEELIYPARHEMPGPGRHMWARISHRSVEELITDDEYEALKQKLERKEKSYRKFQKWKKRNPDVAYRESPYKTCHDPWSLRERIAEFEPFDPSTVYFDDIAEHLADKVRYYNRIALIIQGLYDRSQILHPHPPVKIWTAEGFEEAVELIYADRMLEAGEAPNFEAYRAELNASLEAGCVTIGQHDFWMRAEAEKENARRDRDWRDTGTRRPSHFRLYGNPGPGELARIVKWRPRAKKARFEWLRERLTRSWEHGWEPISTGVTVPADELFNVDAYQPGDFRRFYEDPRTRRLYLKWAGLMLLAEEYHAGNARVRDPDDIRDDGHVFQRRRSL